MTLPLSPKIGPNLGNFLELGSYIDRRLQTHLLDHHHLADETFRKEWAAHHAPLVNGAAEGTSLWRAQQGLTGASIPSGPLDDSFAFLALRDEAEEPDFAAARAQSLIDQGSKASPCSENASQSTQDTCVRGKGRSIHQRNRATEPARPQ